MFNTWTALPVILHGRIARINQVYVKSGTDLRYVDAGTEDAGGIMREGKCVVIVPERFDASRFGEFQIAHASGMPRRLERDSGTVFALSDQADLEQLLSFVREARPKAVLTFSGGASVLAELVTKRPVIPTQILHAEVRSSKTVEPVHDEELVAKCENYFLSLLQEPNFTYGRQGLIARAITDGFKLQIVEEALNRLMKKKRLRYSDVTNGYSLSDRSEMGHAKDQVL